MTPDSGETIRRLAAMTDAGAFERLATAVLRIARPEYHALSHPGVNADGKTVVSPVDGIAMVPGSDPPHLVAAQHTTCALEKLRGKWLGEPEGDLPKTAGIVAEERVRSPDTRATLALTTNREPPQDLVRDVAAQGQRQAVDVDVWSAARLAHVLDHTADGQWVRRQHLGIAQQRLSRGLLRDLSEGCVRDYPHLFDRPDLWVERALDGDLRRAAENARDVLFLVADSGLGKSSACYGLLRRHVAGGGCGLVLPHDVVLEASSPDGAVEIALRRLCLSLEPGCGANAVALGMPDAPLLLVVEDVNKAPRPHLVVERLAGWAAAAKRGCAPADADATRTAWRLVCPVWPQVLTNLRDDARKGVEALSLYAGPLTPDEGRAAVQRRAAYAGGALSDLQAGAIAGALGHDPLLIALHDPAVGDTVSDPDRVIERFVTGSLQRFAGEPGSSFAASDLRASLRELAGVMLEDRSLAPTWVTLRSRFGGDRESLDALRTIVRQRDVMRLEPSGADERLAFRHDRVRDWLLADGIAALMRADRLPSEVLEEPFWAEAIGAALVLAPDLPDALADRVRATNPLALFHAFRRFAEPGAPLHHAVVAAIRAWLADPATHGRENQHLRWAAQSALAKTDSPLVLEFLEHLKDRSWALLEGRFRNGDLLAGVEYCCSFDPGSNFPRRDRLIEHALAAHGPVLLRQLDALLRNPTIGERARRGTLHLAGHIGDPGLIDALVACWTAAAKPAPDLDAFLWAAARCAPPNDPARLLAPVCDAWGTLSNERGEKGSPSPRNELAAHGIRWAFSRGIPDGSLRYFIERTKRDDLRWPITYMLRGMDHPDAVAFIAREIAEIARKKDGANGYSHLGVMVFRHWGEWDDDRERLSKQSRERLHALWSDSPDAHLRRAAFRMWAARVDSADLSLLRAISDSDPLADKALAARLRAADQEAIPALLAKLAEADNQSYWWQFARRFWNDDLTAAIDRELHRRSGEAKHEWKNWVNTDWVTPGLLMRLDDLVAEDLLCRHWRHLRYSGSFVAAALYTATPRTRELAAEALRDCPDTKDMLRHLSMDYGIKTRDHPGVTEQRRIDSLLPYLDCLDELSIWRLWDLCNERGWLDWRRHHLDGRLSREQRQRQLPDDHYLWAELDQFASEGRSFWPDHWFEQFARRHDSPGRAMAVLGAWLRARRSLPALRVAAEVVAFGGRRDNLAVLEVDGIEPADETAAIRADARYAIRRRTPI